MHWTKLYPNLVGTRTFDWQSKEHYYFKFNSVCTGSNIWCRVPGMHDPLGTRGEASGHLLIGQNIPFFAIRLKVGYQQRL